VSNMKRMSTILCIALCVVLVISGCGGGKPAQDNVDEKPEAESVAEEPKEQPVSTEKPKASGSYEKIKDFSEAWTALIDVHEPAINAFDEPLLELLNPGVELCFCVNYDMLNMDNKEGRHEGNFFILDYPAFVEKKGPQLTFGYEYTRTEESSNPNHKVGDKLAENGCCDLDKGFFQIENHTLRGEDKTVRTYVEIKEVKKSEMCCLRLYGSKFDVKMNEKPWTICTYMRVDKDTMDFVHARSIMGPNFEKLSIADKGILTKEEAVAMMEDAGFDIVRTGGIADEKVSID
jgi:hypothetical protein